MKDKITPIIKKIIILAVWLAIWQIASTLTGLELLFASPVAVFREFVVLLGKKSFYVTVLNSFVKITCGYITAFIIAVLFGCLAGKYKIVKDFLAPCIHIMKSLPVAAFIIILLMWFDSDKISFVIGGMVVVPIIYTSVVQGIENMDYKLEELVFVYKMKFLKRIRYIYFPQIYPYVESNSKVALGMCWKAGVSAEVIGLAANSIGLEMYYSKLYLLSADLFVWSIVVIFLSVVFEKIMLLFMRFIKDILAK